MADEGPPLDKQKLAAARLSAASKFPYLASALFALTVVERPEIGTISTDEHWRLYVDPAVVDDRTVDQLAGNLVHHVSHLLRDHGERARAQSLEGKQDTKDWLRAADAEIDDDLVEIGLVDATADSLPSTFGAPDGLLAEEYFLTLQTIGSGGDGSDGSGGQGTGGSGDEGDPGGDAGESSRDGEGDQDGDGEGGADGSGDTPSDDHGHDGHDHGPNGDCGSGAHGQPRAWEVGGGDANIPGMGEEAARLLRASIAQAMRQHNRQHPGSIPGSWMAWADSLLDPVVDWRRALAAEIRRGVHNVAGRVDYSYRRPGRRTPPGSRIVQPSLHRPIPEVAVVCDTSGSMAGGALDRVLAEVEGILVGVGLRSGQVRILTVDAAVHGGAQRVRKASDVRLAGGGGTDMGVGIEAAAALRPRPRLVVVLTDGYTPWPAEPPRGISVVVGRIGSAESGSYPSPAYARTIEIDL